MKKILYYILLIILLSFWGIILTNKDQYRNFFQKALKINQPCAKPIEYSLGNIDPRFSLKNEDLVKDIASAEKIWEDPLGRNLFQYNPGAAFKINLVFDERQERTIESGKLENQLGKLENAHEEVVSEYQSLSSAVKKRLDSYNTAVKSYEKDLADYNADVSWWNVQGGAPPNEYEKLQNRHKKLDERRISLNNERLAINSLVGKTNTLVGEEQKIVKNYNTNIETYREKYGGDRQFDQGMYLGDHIDIYEFQDLSDLQLVMAHELGHALGLGHVNDPKSIMYYLMGEQNVENPTLSSDDILALKTVCRMK